MSSPLVSVVIPTFNRAGCLRRAIDSALHQTHRNVEIIVVDDGSTDETPHVVQSDYSRESRVRYVHQANAGVSTARNHGFALATGEFIALLDSDDEWYPWKLAVQLACLRSVPDAGMIWTDMDAVAPNGTVTGRKYLKTMYSAYQLLGDRALFDRHWLLGDVMPDCPVELRGVRLSAGDIFSEMLLGNLVHTSTVLLRRERLQCVGGFDPELKQTGEDYDFHWRTCRAGAVAFLDVSSIRYQIGMGDALTRPELKIHMALNDLRTVLGVLEADRARIRLPQKTIDARIASSYFWVGEACADMGKFHEARPFVLKGLLHEPNHLRPWEILLLSFLPNRVGIDLKKLVHLLKHKQHA